MFFLLFQKKLVYVVPRHFRDRHFFDGQFFDGHFLDLLIHGTDFRPVKKEDRFQTSTTRPSPSLSISPLPQLSQVREERLKLGQPCPPSLSPSPSLILSPLTQLSKSLKIKENIQQMPMEPLFCTWLQRHCFSSPNIYWCQFHQYDMSSFFI